MYAAVYVVLLGWFIVSGLHIVQTSFWVPIFLMTVLDWVMTRDTKLRYVFAAFLMLALLAIFMLRLVVAPEASLWLRSVYDVAAFLAVFAGYQVLLWRVVLRRAT